MKKAGNREDFIREMRRRGYDVRWKEGRKSITYTTPTGMKCRNDKLHERKFRKGKMEDEFRIRLRAAQQRSGQVEAADAFTDRSAPQRPLHDAHADGGTAGERPAEHVGAAENIRSSMSELATKESLQPFVTAEELLNWVNNVQELNREMYQSMRQVLAEMREENRQAGKKRDEFLRTLSDMERRFQRDGEDLLNTFRLWTPLTFIGAAAVSTVFTILMRILLR